MDTRAARILILLTGVGLLCPSFVGASMMVGLLPKQGVRLQEFWDGPSCRYCLYNAREESVQIVVLKQARRQSTAVSLTPPVPGDTLAVWDLGPREFLVQPAIEVEQDSLFRFVANGQVIGTALERGEPPTAVAGCISMFANLDTPGWWDAASWTEQPALWFDSGADFDIRVLLAPGAGLLTVPREGSPGHTEDRLYPYSVVSSTPGLVTRDTEFELDAFGPGDDGGRHQVILRFHAPEVGCLSLFRYCVRIMEVPGKVGHWIVRAVLIRPVPDAPSN